LAAFQAEQPALHAAAIATVVASTDDREHAAATVERHGLAFPVGYGLPLHETAALLGAYFEERRSILHATGFVLRPGGVIAVAQYSSGAIGRLVAGDVIRLVETLRSRG